MAQVPTTTIGQGLKTGKQGLGCMSLTTGFYGAEQPCPESQAISVIHTALDNGATLLSTADFYGFGESTNEKLIAKAIKGRPRDSFQIASKWGAWFEAGKPPTADFSRENGIRRLEGSLKRLGLDYLDVWIMRSSGKPSDLEESIGVMKEMVEAGKVKHLGVSELSAADIRRAHAVYPLTLVEQEWNLFSRDIEDAILPTCRELGIGIMAYSPMGRGLLTGMFDPKTLVKGDFRSGDMTASTYYGRNHYEENLKAVEKVKALAAAKGVTAGQLALAWVTAQGPDVVPIPGTKNPKYVLTNIEAASIELSAKDMKDLEEAVPMGSRAGERYPGGQATYEYDKY